MRQVVFRYPLAACIAVAFLTLFSSVHVLRSSRNAQSRTGLELFLVPAASALPSEMAKVTCSSPQERTNIFFLKAHKCASSTVQNILMRFGFERGLTFVLPSVHNYIGSPDPFSPELINEQFATASGKYNIFTHHSRYDSEGVRQVMYSDAAFVTILRHPADVYESIFSYYNFQRVFNVTFEELLKSPESLNKINKRYFNKIGFNQMSFDLGFPVEDFANTLKIRKFIEKIDKEFDLVMMSEWMEVSLVLLADLMNWSLENVISLRLNSRTTDSIYRMSNVERTKVIELNSADYQLYTFFLKRFRDKIKEYGEERMKRSVESLLTLNLKLNFRCVEGTNTRGYGHTKSYRLRSEGDWLCFRAAQAELSFTEELREIQRQRTAVLNKLESLLNTAEKGDPM